MRKEAIVLVAFGSTTPETQSVFNHVEAQVREAFPGVSTGWAYTSGVVRSKLAKLGKLFDSPEVALARFQQGGYSHVALLSLHTIPGIEFHQLVHNAKNFEVMAAGLSRVVVAKPLLASHQDLKRAAAGIVNRVPTDRRPEDAVVLVGHGSEKHAADLIYTAVHATVRELDPRVFLASVQGYPGLGDILPKLRQTEARRVFLMPFMSVAGEHARKDMAGEEPASFKSILEREGYEVLAVLKGTAEYPEILEIWMDHLRVAMAELREDQ